MTSEELKRACRRWLTPNCEWLSVKAMVEGAKTGLYYYAGGEMRNHIRRCLERESGYRHISEAEIDTAEKNFYASLGIEKQ